MPDPELTVYHIPDRPERLLRRYAELLPFVSYHELCLALARMGESEEDWIDLAIFPGGHVQWWLSEQEHACPRTGELCRCCYVCQDECMGEE